MSEVVRHIGKVRKVDLKGLSIEEWCKAKCIELGIEKQKHWYNSYEETLQEEMWPTKFVKVNGDIWEIVEDREEEDYENLSIIRPNEDGTLNYILQFYNGGTCLSEMLEEGILKCTHKQ